MHILTVLCSGGWMPENLSEGWRRLGCSVEEFFYGTHMGKAWSREGQKQNRQINQSLWETAFRLKRENSLDLIFAVIYDDVLEVETVQKLRLLDVPLINYHVDLVGQWYRILRTGKYFDYVACAQRDQWEGLTQAGIRPYYLPMAANPPKALSAANTDPIAFDGVLYLGSPWTYRRKVLAEIAHHSVPLRIYGNNWLRTTTDPSQAQPWQKNLHDLRYYLLPRLRLEGTSQLKETLLKRLQPPPPLPMLSTDIPKSCIQGSYERDRFVSLVQGAAVNLGFTHFKGAPGTPSEMRQLRLRDFEIPMAGGFYLSQDCPQLHELFQVGQTAIAWNKICDLIEKINFYLNNPQERRIIAQASQDYCLKHHTWETRFRELLRNLNISPPYNP